LGESSDLGAKGEHSMKRETLITVALVIAGIILAFVLFAAGAC
jgi:hypothetical protein